MYFTKPNCFHVFFFVYYYKAFSFSERQVITPIIENSENDEIIKENYSSECLGKFLAGIETFFGNSHLKNTTKYTLI